MKKRKQILSTLLAVAMVSTLFTGCGQTQEQSAAESTESSAESSMTESESAESVENAEGSGRISEETITLSVAGPYCGGSTSDWNSTIQFAAYEELLGIKFDATTYDEEQWKSKLTLLMASDEMPDIIAQTSLTPQDVAEYGRDGYFLDFSEYLDLMPNFKKVLDAYPEYARNLMDEEGHIYAIGALNCVSDSGLFEPIYISKAWLNNLGLAEPKSLDELYDVLVAFKEQDANGNGDADDEIPMAITSANHRSEYPILWAFGIHSNRSSFHMMINEDGKVVLGDSTENYKDFLKYMNMLYEEGLINQDAYVITNSEMSALLNEGKVGIYGTYALLPGNIPTDWSCVVGYTHESYSIDRTVALSSRVSQTYRLAVNAETEYPEEIAKFVDYLFTEEGSISALNGYEGKSFDYVDVGGSMIINNLAYAEAAGYESGSDYRAQVAVAVQAFELYKTNKSTLYEVMENTPTENLLEGASFEIASQNTLKELAYRTENVTAVNVYPTLKYTEAELEERSTLYTDISNYLTSVKSQFITGEKDIDADWDEHLAQLNAIGLERYLEIEQAAYDRYMKN